MVKRGQAGREGREGLVALPCACANLRRAARAVTQLYGQELRRSGLEPGQFGLLSALAAVGEVSQGRLGEGLAIDSTTLTRTLAPLGRRGWIRVRQGEDRRERLLSLTAAGRRQAARAQPCWERAQRRLRRALGEEQWSGLQEALLRVTQAACRA